MKTIPSISLHILLQLHNDYFVHNLSKDLWTKIYFRIFLFLFCWIKSLPKTDIFLFLYLCNQRPNLKNLIRGLNLSRGSNLGRGSNMVVPLKIVFNFSRFKPLLNWNRFLTDLSRGSNSLNSDIGLLLVTLYL